MLPPACSIVTPSVPLVQAMLTRAQLPINTIALAVCVLDSLDSRFARTWRLTCPLGAAPQTTTSSSTTASTAGKRHTLPSPLTPPLDVGFDHAPVMPDRRLLHIDAVFPEVIILAALVIAAKFDDDRHATQQPAQAYCTAWGSGGVSLWTGAQLATTERCIMQSLGYRILPLLDEDLLADACADMRRAGVQALRAQKARATAAAGVITTTAPSKEDAVVSRVSPAPAPSLSPSPSAAETATLSPDHASLCTVMRRHHIPSHSECIGLATFER